MIDMDELMLKIDNVSKVYKLGQIGGTTFRDELQRFGAKLLKKEDPTKRIGAKEYNKGDTFKALNRVSFEVKKGERVGIIGHNGAGKSTLLKLISRVTAPTSGEIGMNGRIASMLEVGTGFHPELTGRENVYMNGAILGMTKAEIDKKMEDIIEFSECRQFIDTPVKRYSSGMYVKLAFSVAAHLDSEILIMDEVLAVGDMAFQKKCLDKMSDVSKKDGRTILYVSHNMNTIRQLCDRCVVMDHGTIIFDGDVEAAINIYQNKGKMNYPAMYDYTNMERMDCIYTDNKAIHINNLQFKNKNEAVFDDENVITMLLGISVNIPINNVYIRVEIYTMDERGVCAAFSEPFSLEAVGEKTVKFDLDVHMLVTGEYKGIITMYSINNYGVKNEIDAVAPGFYININKNMNIEWLYRYWGNVRLDNFFVG